MFGTQFYTEKVYWIFLHFNCSISISFLRMIGGFRGGHMKNRGLEMKEEQKGKNWSTKLVANIILSSSELHNIIIFFGSLFLALFVTFLIIILRFFFLFFFTCRQIHQLYTKEISFFLSFGGTGGVATFSRGESINIPAAGIVFFRGKHRVIIFCLLFLYFCIPLLFHLFVFLMRFNQENLGELLWNRVHFNPEMIFAIW